MATLASMTVDLNMDSSGVASGARAASASVERMTINIRRTTDSGMEHVAHNMDGRLRDIRGNLVRSGRRGGTGFARTMVSGISRGLRNAGSSFMGALSGSLEQVQSAMSSNPYTAGIGAALAAGIVATALPMIGALISGAVIAIGALGVIGLGAVLLKDEPEVKKAAGHLKKTVGKILKGAAKPLVPSFVDSLKKIEHKVKDLKPVIEKMFKSVKPAIPALTDGILDGAADAFKGFTDMVAKAKPVTDAVARLFRRIGGAVGDFFEIIGKRPKDAAAAIDDLGKMISLVIKGVAYFIVVLTMTYGYVHKFVAGVIHFFQWLYDVLVGHSIIPDLINAIVSWFKSLPGKIWGAVTRFAEGIVSRISSMAKRGYDAVKRFVSDVVRYFKGFPRKAANAISSLAGKVYRKVRDAGRDMYRAAKNGVRKVVGAVRGLPGKAIHALGNIGRKLYRSGRSLVYGFIDGIRSMGRKIANAARSIVDRARNFFPFSPAKEGPFSGKGWTLYSGRSLVDGFGEGIASRVPALRKQLGHVMSDLPNGAMNVSPRGVFRAKNAYKTNVVFDVTGADNDMKRMIRKMVRVDGRGNVQSAFG